MSDQDITPAAAPSADGTDTAPTEAPRARKRTGSSATMMPLAIAINHIAKVKGGERSDVAKRVRQHMRTGAWSDLVKAAPSLYGPKGSIKRAPNDRRPWGVVPKRVLRDHYPDVPAFKR